MKALSKNLKKWATSKSLLPCEPHLALPIPCHAELQARQGGRRNAGAHLRGLETTISRGLIHHWGILGSKVRFVVYFDGYVLREG